MIPMYILNLLVHIHVFKQYTLLFVLNTFKQMGLHGIYLEIYVKSKHLVHSFFTAIKCPIIQIKPQLIYSPTEK